MATFAEIILAHMKRYPLMEAQDLYKLAFQAAMGAEHAATNPDYVHLRLMQELGGLTDGPQEPSIDPISPDGRILRVHLRPFILAGGNPLKLSQAFLESARAYRGTTDLLALFWLEVQQQAAGGEIPFQVKELEGYFIERQAGEFQPVHHSNGFRDAYKPAYRVVLREYWKE
ncbi:MAG: hypothetical protein JW704_13000 [Anaerolineaceae bacterium]|nr:hypothetical protein [Anaerolineaceae bacterium]